MGTLSRRTTDTMMLPAEPTMVMFTRKGQTSAPIRNLVRKLKAVLALLAVLIFIFTLYLFHYDPKFHPIIYDGKFLDCSNESTQKETNGHDPLNRTVSIMVKTLEPWESEDYDSVMDMIRQTTETSRTVTPCEALELENWIKLTLTELLEPRVEEYKNPCWNSDQGLLCIPKIMIFSNGEAGLIDFYYRLTSHPQLAMTWGFETNFRPKSISNRQNLKLYGLNMRTEGYFDKNKNKLLVETSTDFIWSEPPEGMKFDAKLALTKRILPDAKIIFLLQDPVKGAWDAICPPEFGPDPRPGSCWTEVKTHLYAFIKKINRDGFLKASQEYKRTLTSFMYILKLHPILKFIPREQLYFVSTSDYSNATRREQIFMELYDFLGVEPLRVDIMRNLASFPEIENTQRHWKMEEGSYETRTAKKLSKLFAPFNEAFFESIGTAFDWL